MKTPVRFRRGLFTKNLQTIGGGILRINSVEEFKELFKYSEDRPDVAVICGSAEEQLNTYLFLRDIGGYRLCDWEKRFIDASPSEQMKMHSEYQHPSIDIEEADEMTGERITYVCTTCRDVDWDDINYDDIAHLINGVLAPDEALQPPDLSGLLEYFS
jgi:hypothetical protein